MDEKMLFDALRSAHNVMGTTVDALESGEPARHRYAKQRLEREMDSIRAALRQAQSTDVGGES